MAALRSNVVLCPATTLLVDKDIQYRCLETGATAFIGDSASVEKFNRVRAQCPSVNHVIQVDGDTHPVGNGVVDLCSELKSVPAEARYEGPKSKITDRSLVYFTSGTSGPPKMVQHNHVSYPLGSYTDIQLSQSPQILIIITGHTLTGKHWLQLSPGKVYWNLSEQGKCALS